MKSILDLLDREVAKLPKVDKASHDRQFKQLCEEAKHERKRCGGRPKSVTEQEHERRRFIWLYDGDGTTGAKKVGISAGAWRDYCDKRFKDI
jgi:hypothetical protein